MMLRMMILRRKTDPKTGDHTLCKPAQSKCTWTFDKSHFEREFTGKMPRAKPASHCAVKMHLDISQEDIWKFTGKMPPTRTATHTLCEPAQSKCTWTFHKSHFIEEFTGKMPPTTTTATHTLCEPAQSKCTWTFHRSHFYSEI